MLVNKNRKTRIWVEYSYLKGVVIQGMNEDNEAMIDDGLDIYEELVRSFIDKLDNWNSKYDRKRAIKESNTLEGGWDEIKWISEDIRDIIDTALNTNKHYIIERVAIEFPLNLAILAFRKDEYYVFDRFLYWVFYCFYKLLNLEPSATNKALLRLCSRHIKSTANYVVAPVLEQCRETQAIEAKYDFALGIILVFNKLLKAAYDDEISGEKQIFTDIAKDLSNTFEYYLDSKAKMTEKIQMLKEKAKSKDEPHASIESKISLLTSHIENIGKIAEAKNLAFYGIAALMIREYERDPQLYKKAPDLFKLIPPFGDLRSNWQLFLKTTDHNVQNEFGWINWEMSEKPEGVVTGISLDQYLNLLCCMNCIKAISVIPDDTPDELSIPNSPNIMYLAESDLSPLMQALKVLENDQKWNDFIDSGTVSKYATKFKNLITKAVDQEHREIDEEVIKAQLNPDKIQSFKDELLSEWINNSTMKNLAKQYKSYIYDSKPEAEQILGIKKLERKDLFIDKPRFINTGGWGKRYGIAIAKSENERALSILQENVASLGEHIVSIDSCTKLIDEALDQLKSAGFSPIIIIINSWHVARWLQQSDDYKESSDYQREIIGSYKKAPMINLNLHGMSKIVIVVDMSKTSVWEQHKPAMENSEVVYIGDDKEISFSLQPFIEETANELIGQQPDIFKDMIGEEKVRHLQQHVKLLIGEAFDFKIRDKTAGIKIDIKDL